MTRSDLVQRLRDTSETMVRTAEELDFYGGSANAVNRAEELAGAAEIVGTWADDLEKEEK